MVPAEQFAGGQGWTEGRLWESLVSGRVSGCMEGLLRSPFSSGVFPIKLFLAPCTGRKSKSSFQAELRVPFPWDREGDDREVGLADMRVLWKDVCGGFKGSVLPVLPF